MERADLTLAEFEHTDEILLDVLNLGEHEVGALHDKGLVAGAVAG